jgi:hypothetical protein
VKQLIRVFGFYFGSLSDQFHQVATNLCGLE